MEHPPKVSEQCCYNNMNMEWSHDTGGQILTVSSRLKGFLFKKRWRSLYNELMLTAVQNTFLLEGDQNVKWTIIIKKNIQLDFADDDMNPYILNILYLDFNSLASLWNSQWDAAY